MNVNIRRQIVKTVFLSQVDQVDAAWSGRVLQAHLLRDRVPPVHGGHAQPRLRQQGKGAPPLETSWSPILALTLFFILLCHIRVAGLRLLFLIIWYRYR